MVTHKPHTITQVPSVVPVFQTGELRLREGKCPARSYASNQTLVMKKDATLDGSKQDDSCKVEPQTHNVPKTLGLGRDGKVGTLSLSSSVSEVEIIAKITS